MNKFESMFEDIQELRTSVQKLMKEVNQKLNNQSSADYRVLSSIRQKLLDAEVEFDSQFSGRYRS